MSKPTVQKEFMYFSETYLVLIHLLLPFIWMALALILLSFFRTSRRKRVRRTQGISHTRGSHIIQGKGNTKVARAAHYLHFIEGISIPSSHINGQICRYEYSSLIHLFCIISFLSMNFLFFGALLPLLFWEVGRLFGRDS
jgi:hypothetical protein